MHRLQALSSTLFFYPLPHLPYISPVPLCCPRMYVSSLRPAPFLVLLLEPVMQSNGLQEPAEEGGREVKVPLHSSSCSRADGPAEWSIMGAG